MKRIFSIKSLLVLIIAALFYNADCRKNRDCHSSYRIRNQTNTAIYFGTSNDSSLSRLDYNPGLSPENYKCGAYSEKAKYGIEGSCIDYLVMDTGYMNIFIFDAGIIETTSWATIKQNRLMLKRTEMTKTQLDSCNWFITYP